MSYMKFENIYKVYNEKTLAIDDFNLEIEKNEFVALIGPSGCGKSTILRMISGLENITYGDLIIDGKRMNDVHAKDRDMSMVFQNYALYPHLTTYDNIAFGLKLRHEKKSIIDERVKSVAKLLDLTDYLERQPSELSGGQRQRVALGRAMVQNSKIFLMDEPLSNLDAKLRNRMRIEILKLHKSLGVTTVYVTHDQVEAMTMADKIVVLDKGKIQQIGTPKELYYNPQNLFVATFIGDPDMNLFTVTLSGNQIMIGDKSISLNPGLYNRLNEFEGKEIVAGVRAEDFVVVTQDLVGSREVFKDKVDIVEMRGDSSVISTHFMGNPIMIKTTSNVDYEIDQEIKYTMTQDRILLFDKETGERI
ncbi:ABC transporter ATP-binding protein [Fundicoccus sp. Sow4_H7]|uniref:ABC transporter ATP-binding protein n=1 Tax=Fundicoccus sp. Sow4_H7 TaxID=3438784 RepID=UPI003F8DB1D2